MNNGQLQFLLKMRDQASQVLKAFGSTLKAVGGNAASTAAQLKAFGNSSSSATNQTNMLGAAINALRSRWQQLTGTGQALNSQLQNLNQNANGAKTGIQGVTHAMTEMNQSMELINRSMEGVKRTMNAPLEAFRQYDKGMTVVQRVTQMSDIQMMRFTQSFDTMSQRMRAVPVERLNEIAGQAVRLGITGTNDILKFTETIAKLESSLTDLGEDAPMLISRVLNATGEGVAGVEKFANVLVRMSNDASASDERILHMTAMIAQATAQFNMSSEAMLAMATAAADLNFAPELFGTGTSRALTQLNEAVLNNTQGMRTLTEVTGLTAQQFGALLDDDPAMALITFAEVLDDVEKSGRSVSAFLEMFNLNADENKRILGSLAANTDAFRKTQISARTEAVRQIALNQQFATTLQSFNTAVEGGSNAWKLFKKTVGAALAPVAVVALKSMTSALNLMSAGLEGMGGLFGGIVAWTVVLGPALISVALALRALYVVIMLMLQSQVIGYMGAFAAAVWKTNIAIIALTGNVLRMAVATIASLFGIQSAALLIPLAIGAAVTAVIAALALLAYYNWDDIKAFFSQSWSDIGRDIRDTLVDSFKTAISEITDEWDRFVTTIGLGGLSFGGGPPGGSSLLYNGGANPLSFGADMGSATARALTGYDSLWEWGTAPTRGGGGYGASFSGNVGGPQGWAPATAQLTGRLNNDVTKVTQISTENAKVVEELDNFTDALRRAEQQAQALDALRGMPADDVFFRDQGVTPTQVPAYIDRLEGLMRENMLRLDPVTNTLRDINTQVQYSTSPDFARRQTGEIMGQLFELRGEKGDLTTQEGQAVAAGIRRRDDAVRGQQVEQLTFQMERQAELAAAVTADEQLQVAIKTRLLELERQFGDLTQKQEDQIALGMIEEAGARRKAALTEELRGAQEALDLATARTQTERDTLAIKQQINAFENANGALEPDQRAAYDNALRQAQVAENMASLREELNPVEQATIAYADAQFTLTEAWERGLITAEEMAKALERLEKTTRAARDPVGELVRSLGVDAAQAGATTFWERQRLEIQELIRETDLASDSFKMGVDDVRIAESIRARDDAARAAAVTLAVQGLEEQATLTAALTADERLRVQIYQRLVQMARDLGDLTKAQQEAISEAMQEQFAAARDASLANNLVSLDAELMKARQITQAQRERAEIVATIAAFERQNGKLSDEQRATYEAQLRALQQIQSLNDLVSSLDGVGFATQAYQDDVRTLGDALARGAIDIDQYTQLMKRLEQTTLEARQPFAALIRDAQDAFDVQRITGQYQDADRETTQQVIDMRRQGVQVTQEQIDKLTELNRAMQDLQMIQDNGLGAWVDDLGTAQERVLKLQEDLATTFSDGLFDVIWGVEDAWENMVMEMGKSISRFFFDNAMQPLMEGLNNLFGGGEAEMSAEDRVIAALESAAGVITTQDMIVTAQQVEIAGGIPDSLKAPDTKPPELPENLEPEVLSSSSIASVGTIDITGAVNAINVMGTVGGVSGSVPGGLGFGSGVGSVNTGIIGGSNADIAGAIMSDPASREMLAKTIQAEAGGEGPAGMLAVGEVIANRLNSGQWGNSLEDVIMADGQFSAWNKVTGYAGGAGGLDMDRMTPSAEAWAAADAVLAGRYQPQTNGALNYYNPEVANPAWGAQRAGGSWQTIGNHVFGTAGGGGSMSGSSASTLPMENWGGGRAIPNVDLTKIGDSLRQMQVGADIAAVSTQNLATANQMTGSATSQAANASTQLGQAAGMAAPQVEAAAQATSQLGSAASTASVAGGVPTGGGLGGGFDMGSITGSLVGFGLSLLMSKLFGGGGSDEQEEPKLELYDDWGNMVGYWGDRGPQGTSQQTSMAYDSISGSAKWMQGGSTTSVEIEVSPSGEFDTRVAQTSRDVSVEVTSQSMKSYDSKVAPKTQQKTQQKPRVRNS